MKALNSRLDLLSPRVLNILRGVAGSHLHAPGLFRISRAFQAAEVKGPVYCSLPET